MPCNLSIYVGISRLRRSMFGLVDSFTTQVSVILISILPVQDLAHHLHPTTTASRRLSFAYSAYRTCVWQSSYLDSREIAPSKFDHGPKRHYLGSSSLTNWLSSRTSHGGAAGAKYRDSVRGNGQHMTDLLLILDSSRPEGNCCKKILTSSMKSS